MKPSMQKASFSALPNGYAEAFKINLQADKKLLLLINGLAVVIMAVCLVIGVSISPYSIGDFFDEVANISLGNYILKMVSLLAAIVGYMILHELIHGITMMCFGTKKVKYGFTGMYAFAGSDDYYTKIPYIVIALAPVVVWGVVLLVLTLLLPAEWFWFVYIIQIVNLSGAAGDLYVTWRFSKLPADILVRDTGTEMTVYMKQ